MNPFDFAVAFGIASIFSAFKGTDKDYLAKRLDNILVQVKSDNIPWQDVSDKVAGVLDDYVVNHDIKILYKDTLYLVVANIAKHKKLLPTKCPESYDEAKKIFGWEKINEKQFESILNIDKENR